MNDYLKRIIYYFQKMRMGFQHCCHCHRLALRSSYLCKKCFALVADQLAVSSSSKPSAILHFDEFNEIEFKIALGGLKGLYLGSYKNSVLRAWILSLKGGGIFEDYLSLAQLCLDRRTIQGSSIAESLFDPVVIVPSPSRAKSFGEEGGFTKIALVDHAASLARALSQITGWPVKDLLKFSLDADKMKEQKDKSWDQRRQRKFHLKKPKTLICRQTRILKSQSINNSSQLIHEGGERKDQDSDFIEYGTIIFIDDVVTTGSTARAAWKALGCPEFFEVWCIAFQPKTTIKGEFRECSIERQK